MHEDPLIEADYMNDDYLEAKSVPGQILDRPVTGRPVVTGRPDGNQETGRTGRPAGPIRSSKTQTGSISAVNNE